MGLSDTVMAAPESNAPCGGMRAHVNLLSNEDEEAVLSITDDALLTPGTKIFKTQKTFLCTKTKSNRIPASETLITLTIILILV